MRFNHKFKLPAQVVARAPSGNSKVQKHFKEEVDINNILAKYRKTGIIEHVARGRKLYGDFTEVKDVAEAMDVSARAKAIFEELPATLRNEFKNSIPGFFDFINDEKNFDKCVEWGIFEKPKAPEPEKVMKVEVVTPPAPNPDSKK